MSPTREWETPTIERSPEVLFTLAAMDQSGVDFCLDVHGDEELPYNFLSGCEGIPGYADSQIPHLCDVFARVQRHRIGVESDCPHSLESLRTH